MINPDGECHLGVGAAIAENDPLILPPVALWLEHPSLEGRALAGIDSGAHRGGSYVVLVAAVLAVQCLRGDHHGSRLVQHGDLHGHDRQVPLGERDHASRGHLDALAARRPPDDVATQQTVTEVQGALVGLKISYRQQHRLVVDVQLDRFVVRHIDDGLAHSREAKGFFGMPDWPRLVEAVDEGAVGKGHPALLDIPPHA